MENNNKQRQLIEKLERLTGKKVILEAINSKWPENFEDIYDEIIQSLKEAHKLKGYTTFGLRKYINSTFKIGDSLPESRLWTFQGVNTTISLGGVSTIGIKGLNKLEIKKTLKHLQGYTGTEIVLVGGNLSRRGPDAGEVIIKNGKVVRIWN
jgi:hypothetical protein